MNQPIHFSAKRYVVPLEQQQKCYC